MDEDIIVRTYSAHSFTAGLLRSVPLLRHDRIIKAASAVDEEEMNVQWSFVKLKSENVG